MTKQDRYDFIKQGGIKFVAGNCGKGKTEYMMEAQIQMSEAGKKTLMVLTETHIARFIDNMNKMANGRNVRNMHVIKLGDDRSFEDMPDVSEFDRVFVDNIESKEQFQTISLKEYTYEVTLTPCNKGEDYGKVRSWMEGSGVFVNKDSAEVVQLTL